MNNSKEQLMEWISVKDRLPNEGERILTCERGYVEICNYKVCKTVEGQKIEFVDEQDEQPSVVYPTYWMPLPKEPEQ